MTTKRGLKLRWRRLTGTVAMIGAIVAAAPSLAQDAARSDPLAETIVASIPAPHTAWPIPAATELARAIDDATAEGLRPLDYRPAALRRAIAGGEGPTLDLVARASALALAHDYLMGRVGDRETLDWYIRSSDTEAAQLPAALDAAVAQGHVAAFLANLLPSDPRYAALKQALADAPDGATRDVVRANLERWRWMPRALGSNYIYVNVPSYRLEVIDEGAVSATYTVVVGAPDTPTPQLVSDMGSLVVNPWWNVPQSIVKKSAMRPGRAGYVFKAAGNGTWQVRQPPGPRNSLGRIKFNLVNDQAIYLHDTPAKALFARDQRALSHGCIRVKNIDRLAGELMEDGAGTGQLADALGGTQTQTIRLARNWPVYLVYFTLDQDASGRLVRYGDPYGRDAAVVARLDGATMQVASN